MYSSLRLAFKNILRAAVCGSMVFSLSCGSQNLFQKLSDKDQDGEQALYETALKYINEGSYDDALTALDRITSAFRRDKKVVQAFAAAFSGKCGFTLPSLFVNMGSVTATAPFKAMMDLFQNVSVQPPSCYHAQLVMEAVYTASSGVRTTDINFFMALLGIAKLGTYMRSVADVDQDGVRDFEDTCDDANIDDPTIQQIGSGLGLLLDNISALSASLSGNAAVGALENLKTVCGDSCIITDPNSTVWDDGAGAARLMIRSILRNQDFGIGDCVDPTFATCCP